MSTSAKTLGGATAPHVASSRKRTSGPKNPCSERAPPAAPAAGALEVGARPAGAEGLAGAADDRDHRAGPGPRGEEPQDLHGHERQVARHDEDGPVVAEADERPPPRDERHERPLPRGLLRDRRQARAPRPDLEGGCHHGAEALADELGQPAPADVEGGLVGAHPPAPPASEEQPGDRGDRSGTAAWLAGASHQSSTATISPSAAGA